MVVAEVARKKFKFEVSKTGLMVPTLNISLVRFQKMAKTDKALQ
jgi:hypothetical protein